MKKITVFLLLINFLIPTTTQSETSEAELLYDPSENIEILDIHNFHTKIENSQTPWLVKFYLGWCGTCQKLSTEWKKFRNEITPWTDLVKVGAISCSDPANTPVCLNSNISAYPTIKYFPENYKSGDDSTVILKGEHLDVKALKKRVIGQIRTEISEKRGQMYPKLSTYEHPNLEKMFEGLGESVKYVVLVVEAPDQCFATEIALNLHKNRNVSVKFAPNTNTDLVNNLQVSTFPSVVVLDRNNNVSKRFTDPEGVAIESFLLSYGLEVNRIEPNTTKKIVPKKLLRLNQRVKKMGDVVFQVDLEAALRYSLKQEVSAVRVITNERLDALRAYLTVVKKYFPFGENNELITQLVKLTSSSEQVQGVEIFQLVQKAETNRAFSSVQTYLGCLGSVSGKRRYPCSLWQLFHYLTVNSDDETNPREVLTAMHGYIRHFFGCGGCSRHFQQMAIERNLSGVSSLKEAVLWLWEAHNVVNQRLKGDVTEDPEFLKDKFPAKLRCVECYEEDGTWRRNEVFEYLKKMYGKFNVRYVGSDTRVLFPDLDNMF
ncbi:sulfhydryl oxidase 1 [Tribolium castaneum]|uniref:Sulfhydryl oxidase n=1 Tax=Tribolium castaneum TaxID=7070 RepID=D6WHZ4_TRICA|nr:PREDICTED: sulfhydryl oxidase 1 [Tribolium castaneum]EEZ99709.1 Sulfhydryl oxidase 1-like Protein [Tribolium castaneum]|eukprot:XP_967414.1 PREDICTED: sulfhydryl oxidase 1 [Tribolium castaneum]